MMKLRIGNGKNLPLAICCLVSSLMLLPLQVHPDEQGLPFETSVALLESTPMERLLDGKVEAINQATVSSQTSGRIAAVNYDVDDFVEAGSIVVRFTDIEQQAALRQAEAQLREARARLTEAEENFSRAQNLLERGLGSQRDLDRSVASRDAAGARVSASVSAVQTAQQQVEYTLVRAPYAGIVTQRYVEPGEAMVAGQPIMSGISLEQLRIVVDMPQKMAQEVRSDPRAELLVDAGRITPEKITLFPLADPVTNTFKVRLDLPPGQFDLYPGMFVKVAFLIGDTDRLLIPQRAVVQRSEVTAVYIVNGEDVRLRQVRMGQQFGDRVEILAGLQEGETFAMNPVAAGIFIKTGNPEQHP